MPKLETSIKPGTVIESNGESYTVVETDLSQGLHRYAQRHGFLCVRASDGAADYMPPKCVDRIASEPAAGVDAIDKFLAAIREVVKAEMRLPHDPVQWNEAIAELAIQHEREIYFDYQKSPSSAIEARGVEPTVLEDGIIGGHDIDHDGDYRSFRLDRIVGYMSVR